MRLFAGLASANLILASLHNGGAEPIRYLTSEGADVDPEGAPDFDTLIGQFKELIGLLINLGQKGNQE